MTTLTSDRRARRLGRRLGQWSERALVYRDREERAWSIYGRRLALWGWRRRDVVRVAALLAGAIITALLNSGADALPHLEWEDFL